MYANCHCLLDVGCFAGAADEGHGGGQRAIGEVCVFVGGGEGEEVGGEATGGQQDDVYGRE